MLATRYYVRPIASSLQVTISAAAPAAQVLRPDVGVVYVRYAWAAVYGFFFEATF